MSQEVSSFLAGDHKAAMNRHKSIKNINNTNDPQKVPPWNGHLKLILLKGFNQFHGANLTLNSDVKSRHLDVWFP